MEPGGGPEVLAVAVLEGETVVDVEVLVAGGADGELDIEDARIGITRQTGAVDGGVLAEVFAGEGDLILGVRVLSTLNGGGDTLLTSHEKEDRKCRDGLSPVFHVGFLLSVDVFYHSFCWEGGFYV